MADTQTLINWAVNGITIILLIVAGSMAIKKKKNIILGVAVLGNLAVYYFTQSPLLCWIVSIACIIWASKTREPGDTKPAESQKASVEGKKIGNVVGLIIGIGLLVGPLIGYMRQEASLSDPTTQGVLILFALIGAFMIMNNIFKLFEHGSSAPAVIVQAKTKAVKEKTEEESKGKMIRCRFCKKLYSAEYNGCPYCKKK